MSPDFRPSARPPLDQDAVAALRAVGNRFGPADNARKAALLRSAARRPIADSAVLVAYHDVLLFLLAYPATPALRRQAGRELERVADAARTLVERRTRGARAKLRGSGIAWSETTVAFGWCVARWLVRRFAAHAEVDSFAAGALPLADLVRHALPAAEAELVAAAGDADELLAQAAAHAPGTRLAWLVAHWQRLPCGDALRETLFDALGAFVRVEPRDSTLSRTFARGVAGPVHYHRSLLRDFAPAAAIAAALSPPLPLSRSQRAGLVDTARGVLALLGRETDPISQADPARTRCHPLGRGVTIALYSAAPDRRPAFDSHVGFVLFKNAVPIAYGGGWPLLATCRIGVNVFAPFRGGESAWLFCQVLRAYRALFGVRRFLVEPYQFGAGNREGLASGAFWFYWRLGFRPVDRKLRALGEAEAARMAGDPAYRTPLPVLRRFTRSDLALAVAPDDGADADAAELSAAVTRWIGTRFRADRTRAEAAATRSLVRALAIRDFERWPRDERIGFAALAPLVAQIPRLAHWPAVERARLVAWLRAKGGDEFRYFALLERHGRLRRALAAIAARERAAAG